MNNLKIGDKIKYTENRWDELKKHFKNGYPNGPFVITRFWGTDESDPHGGFSVDHSKESNLGSDFSSFYKNGIKCQPKPTVII